jgi:hypothetical protein
MFGRCHGCNRVCMSELGRIPERELRVFPSVSTADSRRPGYLLCSPYPTLQVRL